ncbi:recombinase family protein [Ciceribacter sp. RN22]|uniref:recombinase family protein n=1 Tax=Ciceribacter sp. RN22 TaxID=2954932 RepID=UPI0027E25D91|nr:recombinase family protein [Ciceribacter sp. RN22]
MIIGYARVSTEEQRLDLQLQALKAAGCERIFSDHGESGTQFERTGLDATLAQLRPGDTLVVWRLDRLGRSLSALVGLLEKLGRRGVSFRSLTENIDTASSGGRLMFHMMAALAEFERSIIGERTRAGMAAARARGKRLGRPRALTEEQLRFASCSITCRQLGLHEVARELNVSSRTLKRNLATTDSAVLSCGSDCQMCGYDIPTSVPLAKVEHAQDRHSVRRASAGR